MQDFAVLGVNSYTSIDQELEGNLIHIGTPVSLTLPIQSVEESKNKAEKIKLKPSNAEVNQNEINQNLKEG
jgi:hypothetical protein